MVWDNEMVSKRQMERQLLLSTGGSFLLILPQLSTMRGWSGVIGIVLGFFMAGLYLFFLLRTPQRKATVLLRMVCFAYFLVMGSLLVKKTSVMVCDILLPDSPVWLIGALILAVAWLGTGRDLQRVGRLAAVSNPIIAGGFCVLLLTAVFQIPVDQLKYADLTGPEISSVMINATCFLGGFLMLGILPFWLSDIKGEGELFFYLERGLAILTGFLVLSFLVLQLLFGCDGMGKKRIPIIALMSDVNIPGGLFDRLDVIWIMFLLYALLYAVGFLLFCIRYLAGKKDSVVAVGALVMLFASMTERNGWNIERLCRVMVPCVFIPAFVIVGLIVPRVRRRR